jgi:hypothetical protein
MIWDHSLCSYDTKPFIFHKKNPNSFIVRVF